MARDIYAGRPVKWIGGLGQVCTGVGVKWMRRLDIVIVRNDRDGAEVMVPALHCKRTSEHPVKAA